MGLKKFFKVKDTKSAVFWIQVETLSRYLKVFFNKTVYYIL